MKFFFGSFWPQNWLFIVLPSIAIYLCAQQYSRKSAPVLLHPLVSLGTLELHAVGVGEFVLNNPSRKEILVTGIATSCSCLKFNETGAAISRGSSKSFKFKLFVGDQPSAVNGVLVAFRMSSGKQVNAKVLYEVVSKKRLIPENILHSGDGFFDFLIQKEWNSPVDIPAITSDDTSVLKCGPGGSMYGNRLTRVSGKLKNTSLSLLTLRFSDGERILIPVSEKKLVLQAGVLNGGSSRSVRVPNVDPSNVKSVTFFESLIEVTNLSQGKDGCLVINFKVSELKPGLVQWDGMINRTDAPPQKLTMVGVVEDP